MEKQERDLVAKVKFWFGKTEPIFNTKLYLVEYSADGQYAYLFKK